mmetsp:Transcript_25284/g.58238  ORF Transcript_25284/g.58238 Transcript_25284/m.58238 type:complete len:119 (+) Transcript_25284:472-828(+)
MTVVRPSVFISASLSTASLQHSFLGATSAPTLTLLASSHDQLLLAGLSRFEPAETEGGLFVIHVNEVQECVRQWPFPVREEFASGQVCCVHCRCHQLAASTVHILQGLNKACTVHCHC